MTTPIQRIRRSLFFRLLTIFGITIILSVVIIWISLRAMNQNINVVDVIPNFFIRNIESIIEDIGTPPNLANAMRLANELDWSISIRNPIMRWSSDNENRLDVDSSVFSQNLTTDAEIRTINNENIIRVQRGDYDFYLYPRSSQVNQPNFLALYIGLTLAILVLITNYVMVNRLLDPVRLLKRGAERIRKGDLSYRVQTDRQDELGELTESINHMADSLQSMLEAKRQLLLAISHELRTPITKAKLRLEFMPDSEEKEQLKEDIAEIDLLISDLVEAERLNEDHSPLNVEPVLLGEFVSSVAEQYESYVGGINIKIPKQDQEFEIDKLRIRLLLANLINNAIRHSEGNPIFIEVSFENSMAILQVRDQGEGISSEHLSQLSEPFYRADSSRQRNTGGFGLGLYLCRLIAEAHGGYLGVDSKLGEGTCVSVRIPSCPPH